MRLRKVTSVAYFFKVNNASIIQPNILLDSGVLHLISGGKILLITHEKNTNVFSSFELYNL